MKYVKMASFEIKLIVRTQVERKNITLKVVESADTLEIVKRLLSEPCSVLIVAIYYVSNSTYTRVNNDIILYEGFILGCS